MTAVAILLGVSNQLGSDRIEVDVADQSGQIFVSVTDDRLVAALKEMPYFTVDLVKVLSVRLL